MGKLPRECILLLLAFITFFLHHIQYQILIDIKGQLITTCFLIFCSLNHFNYHILIDRSCQWISTCFLISFILDPNYYQSFINVFYALSWIILVTFDTSTEIIYLNITRCWVSVKWIYVCGVVFFLEKCLFRCLCLK